MGLHLSFPLIPRPWKRNEEVTKRKDARQGPQRALAGPWSSHHWSRLILNVYIANWNVTMLNTARVLVKNPKAWGPGSLKFLFWNTDKFTLQQAEGPLNS